MIQPASWLEPPAPPPARQAEQSSPNPEQHELPGPASIAEWAPAAELEARLLPPPAPQQEREQEQQQGAQEHATGQHQEQEQHEKEQQQQHSQPQHQPAGGSPDRHAWCSLEPASPTPAAHELPQPQWDSHSGSTSPPGPRRTLSASSSAFVSGPHHQHHQQQQQQQFHHLLSVPDAAALPLSSAGTQPLGGGLHTLSQQVQGSGTSPCSLVLLMVPNSGYPQGPQHQQVWRLPGSSTHGQQWGGAEVAGLGQGQQLLTQQHASAAGLTLPGAAAGLQTVAQWGCGSGLSFGGPLQTAAGQQQLGQLGQPGHHPAAQGQGRLGGSHPQSGALLHPALTPALTPGLTPSGYWQPLQAGGAPQGLSALLAAPQAAGTGMAQPGGWHAGGLVLQGRPLLCQELSLAIQKQNSAQPKAAAASGDATASAGAAAGEGSAAAGSHGASASTQHRCSGLFPEGPQAEAADEARPEGQAGAAVVPASLPAGKAQGEGRASCQADDFEEFLAQLGSGSPLPSPLQSVFAAAAAAGAGAGAGASAAARASTPLGVAAGATAWVEDRAGPVTGIQPGPAMAASSWQGLSGSPPAQALLLPTARRSGSASAGRHAVPMLPLPPAPFPAMAVPVAATLPPARLPVQAQAWASAPPEEAMPAAQQAAGSRPGSSKRRRDEEGGWKGSQGGAAGQHATAATPGQQGTGSTGPLNTARSFQLSKLTRQPWHRRSCHPSKLPASPVVRFILPSDSDPSALVSMDCTFLFQKQLSAVDAASKSGRIVISKHVACHFPQLREGEQLCMQFVCTTGGTYSMTYRCVPHGTGSSTKQPKPAAGASAAAAAATGAGFAGVHAPPNPAVTQPVAPSWRLVLEGARPFLDQHSLGLHSWLGFYRAADGRYVLDCNSLDAHLPPELVAPPALPAPAAADAAPPPPPIQGPPAPPAAQALAPEDQEALLAAMHSGPSVLEVGRWGVQ